MSKTKIATLILTLSMGSVSYAGTMGPISSAPEHALFASIEGAYTWSSLGNVRINNITLSNSYNGWGGRVAAGAVHHTATPISYTAEMGWGYYANKDYSTPLAGVSKSKDDIYGVDLLVGANYRMNQFDVFGKVGAMIQSESLYQIRDAAVIVGGAFSGVSNVKVTETNILPELKVGGAYNFNEDFALTLSYMHAFGNSTKVRFTSNGLRQDVYARTAPVTLNSVLLGLRYSFA